MSEEVKLDKVYVTTANEAAEFFTYGDVITKEWLIEKFGIKCPKYGVKEDFEKFAFEYLGLVEGLKEHMLIEHKMFLDVVKGTGYRIVKPTEQVGVAMAKMRKNVNKEIRSGVTALININEAQLDAAEIKKRDDALGKLGALSAFHKGEKNYLTSVA